MAKPEIVTSISMTGKMKDQGWGGKSYGEIMAIGSYQGKRSWHKRLEHGTNGGMLSYSQRQGYKTESTSGPVDYNHYCVGKEPNKTCYEYDLNNEMVCRSRSWPYTTMPAGEGGTTRCGGVPEQGKTDKIELWSHQRRSSGHKGYAKDVTFEVNP
jgi:hypothetical protein